LRKEVKKMTIQEMRAKIQEMEQELENLETLTKQKLIKELKLKLMGQICAYEYLILEENKRVA
tara:strand:- start:75 stop:263 length:189 start_codon:yes stop_codon:yes gene_type:complete